MKLDVPPSFLLFGLRRAVDNLVAHDLDVLRFRAEELHEQRADDGRHARGQHNHGDVRRPRPCVELLEMWVELDVFAEEVDALGEGHRDAVDHFLEGFARGVGELEWLSGGGIAEGDGYRKVRVPFRVSSLPFLRRASPKPRLSV